MDNKEVLTNILLSENVTQNFYSEFNHNLEFKNWLNKILPEVELCEKQKQNNPWHLYNVLGHILKSVEEINKQTKHLSFDIRKMLSYVMLLHDIGKPATYIVREKNGKLIDSFFYHNLESEKIAGRVLNQFDFDKNEILIMQKLINKHDVFMFIKDFKTNNPHWRTLSDKVVLDEINDLNQVGNGFELIQYLIYVGRADSRAQNPKLAGESLRMLDKFEKIYLDLKQKNNV